MANNFCEKCGTRREGDARFCIKCGFRFEDDAQITAVQEFNDAEIAEAMQIVREEEGQEPSDKEYSLPVQTASQEPQVKEEAPIKTKKASYKGEVLLLMLSLICFIGSLGFYLATKTEVLDSIPVIYNLKYPDAQKEEEIPVLTVDMAAEVVNNTYWCFPYYYFEGKGMLNEDDYIIHPLSVGMDYEVKCYTADGIDTKEDYFNFFKQYVADDSLVREIFDREHFYIEQNSKLYFSPNQWMGWDYVSAECIAVEKIDDETYCVIGSGYDTVIKYIDNTFKISSITQSEAGKSLVEDGATVTIPDISRMTLDEAEIELEKAGLSLDRTNVTYVAWDDFTSEDVILSAKYSYVKVRPGTAIGIYLAVEDPEYYTRGAKDGKKIPELTPEMASDILDVAAFLPMHIHFNEIGILNENEYINGDYGKYYSAEGMETVADVKNYYRQYVTEAYYIRLTSWYTVYNGKPYFLQYDVGDGGFAPDFMVIEKIDDFAYAVYDTRLMREFVLVYVDGAYKVTNMSVNGI